MVARISVIIMVLMIRLFVKASTSGSARVPCRGSGVNGFRVSGFGVSMPPGPAFQSSRVVSEFQSFRGDCLSVSGLRHVVLHPGQIHLYSRPSNV